MGAHVGNTQHINQEFGQFEGDRRQFFRALPVCRGRSIFEQDRVKMGGHRRTTAAGRDNCIHQPLLHKWLKNIEKAPRQGARFVAIAGIEGGLAATGLLIRKDHLNIVALKQFGRGHAHLWIEHVYHTGDKQRHASRRRSKFFFVHASYRYLSATGVHVRSRSPM